MAEIENLSISVTANAESAIRAFDRLASSADRLRGASHAAARGTEELSSSARDAGTETAEAGREAGSAEPQVRGFGKAAKEAGDNAKKGSGGLKTFWESLKRIAFYRFIRTVLKEITSAFKEGITNLYQWSSAVNGQFAKSMDRIATSTLYLKNSLGAMLAPLINTLAPVIEWIIDRIVDVINWINKLFAALSGSQTYTVAKKVATTWGDAGKSASSSAKKAADDIKRTILGFDEINKLEKQNSSSGSGGSGSSSSGLDYTNMFEERKLDGRMSKLASFIDKFNLQIPAVFAGLLAGFTAVKLAIKAVAALSLGWLKDMAGKTIDIAVSLFRKGWSTLKSWALSFGEAVVDLAVRIKTSVLELWAKLATAWAALSPVLKVGIAISVTAAALWAAYKLAWALSPEKVLAIKAKISTTAAQLKTSLLLGWALLGTWYLNVKTKISTTAAQLKNDVVKSWNGLVTWFLGVKLRIETKLADLWEWVKDNWKIVAATALGVAIAIATPWGTIAAALSSLWADVMASFGGALAFSVVPTLSPTGDYGIGWTPSEFNSKQEEIKSAANELRGSSTTTSTGINTSALKNGLLGVGGLAAVAALASGLFSGGTSTALASVFMPGVNSAADKSPLSPNTSYYNNMTGELVVPNTVDVGVNFTSADNPTYKNKTLGKYLVDTMSKVKSEANTKVSAIAGSLMKLTSNTLNPLVGDTKSNNVVYALAGSGMVQTWDGLMPKTSDTLTTNTVKVAPGTGMIETWGGLMPQVSDTDATAYVSLQKTWWNALWELGLNNLDTTAWVDAMTPWQYWHKSALDWLGLSNLTATVNIVANIASSVANAIRTIKGKAKGGVYSKGAWSDIPAYAGGTLNAHGSLFLAGEAGPEIVGHVGGRTEVLNKSQLASAMYSAVNAAMRGITLDANFYNTGSSEADYDTMYKAMYDAFSAVMAKSDDYNRQKVELLRQINAKDNTVEVTTRQLNKAQTYANRRAGTTVVAVGT